jgi:hypothetical protein
MTRDSIHHGPGRGRETALPSPWPVPAMLALALALAIASACDVGRDKEPEDPSAAHVATGVVREIWRVGGAGDLGGVILGSGPPTHGAVHEDGHVLIVDRSLAEVFLVSPSGDLVTLFGGRGEGP